MKRWLILFAALLVLTGCAAEPEATTPTPTNAPIEIIYVPNPDGCYVPDSPLEASTDGAVQVYTLNRTDCASVVPMGKDLLLFSGTENTTLTLLTGGKLHEEKTVTLECSVSPDSPSVRVTKKGVTYYNEARRELVFLNASLKEVSRTAMPEDIIGSPAVSEDRKTVYYCTSGALRSIDLDSELDKLLKEMPYVARSVTGFHCNDTILECAATDEDGNFLTLFLSAQTGETLYQLSEPIDLQTENENYFAVHYDGSYPELLVGSAEEEAALLNCGTAFDDAFPVLELGSAVLTARSADAARLDCYDLETGNLTASLTVPGCNNVRGIFGDSDGKYIWFLCYDGSFGCDILCRWDPTLTAAAETVGCLTQRYSPENPDQEGLDRCMAIAADLSAKYGVEVLIWKDAAAIRPDEGTLTAEYQVPLIEPSLKQLEAALSRYPQGFLKQAASATDSGTLKICLVRSVGNGEPALQFWTADSACIALCPDDRLEQIFHHELFYILENRVLSTCSVYDTWNSLNPKSFAYDLDFAAAEARTDSQWIEGESRAFIDYTSMSFPREDRARIMEYAMMSGNEACFESDTMQRKLHMLCEGIREAFELDDSSEIFLWEQYLTEPLNE